MHSYFAIWSEPREGGSLLEQALKKSKLARPARNWGATAVEKLRAMAQYQLAVHPLGILGSTAQKTLNTF